MLSRIKHKKILYLFPEKDRFMDKWQRWHFINELNQKGIYFDLVNPKLDSMSNFQEIILNKIKSNINDYSFFMTAMYDMDLSVGFIKEIKSLGLPTLLICWDNLSIPFFHKKLAPEFDLVWLTSYETEPLFKSWKAKTKFLPYAANPLVFKPIVQKQINKVGFLGSLYGIREKKIISLTNSNIPVDVFGNISSKNQTSRSKDYYSYKKQILKLINYLQFEIGRKCLKGHLLSKKSFFSRRKNETKLVNKNITYRHGPAFENINRIYSNYAISLGISELLDTYLLNQPIHKLHLRTFEIPMCGGLQLTTRIPEIEEYFEDKKEILLYNSKEEMVDIANYFIHSANESEVRKLKMNAYQRALNQHTWTNRFSKIEKELFS